MGAGTRGNRRALAAALCVALGVVACGATARPEGRREGALKAPRAVVASVGLHPAERFSRLNHKVLKLMRIWHKQ